MPQRLTHRAVSVSPDDPAFAIDTMTPLPTQWGPVIPRALANIIATDTGVVYVSCTQDFATIAVTVDIWDQTPTDDPTSEGWNTLPSLTVHWPTPNLIIPFTTEPDNGELTLPHPGHYTVDAYHRGRDEAANRSHTLYEQLPELSPAQIRGAAKQFDNLEQYLIRMWPHEPA